MTISLLPPDPDNTPDEETIKRLLHEHDLGKLGCPHDPAHVVKHSHWNGDVEHGHDFSC